MRGQPGFFDIDDRLKRLSDLGDQLETFRLVVIRAVSAGTSLPVRWRCGGCGRQRLLECYHEHYDTLGSEELDDVEALCRACHEGWHTRAASETQRCGYQ
jgi:hypothetical protein